MPRETAERVRRDREQTVENRHSLCEETCIRALDAPKCDSSAGSRLTMMNTHQSEQTVEDGVVLETESDAKPACVALVPVIPSAHWHRAGPQRSLPSSIFVTQLIATAEHDPQTRELRRATPADAQSAYRANQIPNMGVFKRTRQIV